MSPLLFFSARGNKGSDHVERATQFDFILDFTQQAMREGRGSRAWVFAGEYANKLVLGVAMANSESDARTIVANGQEGLTNVVFPTDVPNEGYPCKCLSADMERGHMFMALRNLSYYLPVLNETNAA